MLEPLKHKAAKPALIPRSNGPWEEMREARFGFARIGQGGAMAEARFVREQASSRRLKAPLP